MRWERRLAMFDRPMQHLHWLPALLLVVATALPHAAAPLCAVLRPQMTMPSETATQASGSSITAHPTGDHCDFARCATATAAPVPVSTPEMPVSPLVDAGLLLPAHRPVGYPTPPLTPPPRA